MEDDEREALLRFMRSMTSVSGEVKALSATVRGLAETTLARGQELDALRLTCQALFGVASMRNDLNIEFADALGRVLKGHEDFMLNTALTDQQAEDQRRLALNLLPENLRQLVQLRLLQME